MPVIVISMMLVVVGFVTLMLGVLGVGDSPLDFVYVSIGACMVAAALLVAGVVRGRPSKKPVASSGGQGGDASWAGASAWSEQDSSTGVLEREEQPARPVAARDDRDDRDDIDVVVVPKRNGPSQVGEDTAEPEVDAAHATPEAADARADDGAPHEAVAGDAESALVKKAAAKRAPAKRTAAKRSSAEYSSVEEAAGGTTTGAPAATGTRKVTAKKVATTRASSGATPAPADVDLAVVLSKVSGVGPAKQRLLEQRFGSLEGLRGASRADLVELDGISPTLADRIRSAVR